MPVTTFRRTHGDSSGRECAPMLGPVVQSTILPSSRGPASLKPPPRLHPSGFTVQRYGTTPTRNSAMRLPSSGEGVKFLSVIPETATRTPPESRVRVGYREWSQGESNPRYRRERPAS